MSRSGILLYVVFFILTLATTTLAGVQWLNKDPLELENFAAGLPYSGLLLLVLLSHESGHWIAARIHKVETTYPLFIPFPFFSANPFGTLGAVIRVRGLVPSKRALFDIGASGPISGFVVSAIVLALGFKFLPAREYLYTIHPEYANLSTIPASGLTFGNSFLYSLLSALFARPDSFVPPMNEIYHYPFLCVGWFGLLVTAMNLIPVGQLDGGHISFCMFGKSYGLIARIALVLLTALGLSGLLPLVGIEFSPGWYGWLLWALILLAFMRFARNGHPATEDETPIDSRRFAVGVACWIVFILSFSPKPFSP